MARLTAPGFGTFVYIKQSPGAVAYDAAAAFMRLAKQAMAIGQPFRVALSGGSTPRLLYRQLTSDAFRGEIPWEHIQFFFGDERWVPHDHPDSNYRLAEDELFGKVPVNRGNIFPVPTEGLTPEEAAAQYEQTIRRVFGVAEAQVPSFDLILLGMGEDGHTASLFPHTAALHEGHRLVVAHFVDKLNAYRITLTPVVLNAAANVIFMVTGAGKASALKNVLEGDYDPDTFPAQLLRNALGRVVWLVDKDAALALDKHYPHT
jgi:6-phosphogluconolactonase